MKRHLASVISPTRTPQAQTAAGSPPASSRGLAGGLSVIERNTDGRTDETPRVAGRSPGGRFRTRVWFLFYGNLFSEHFSGPRILLACLLTGTVLQFGTYRVSK